MQARLRAGACRTMSERGVVFLLSARRYRLFSVRENGISCVVSSHLATLRGVCTFFSLFFFLSFFLSFESGSVYFASVIVQAERHYPARALLYSLYWTMSNGRRKRPAQSPFTSLRPLHFLAFLLFQPSKLPSASIVARRLCPIRLLAAAHVRARCILARMLWSHCVRRGWKVSSSRREGKKRVWISSRSTYPNSHRAAAHGPWPAARAMVGSLNSLSFHLSTSCTLYARQRRVQRPSTKERASSLAA